MGLSSGSQVQALDEAGKVGVDEGGQTLKGDTSCVCFSWIIHSLCRSAHESAAAPAASGESKADSSRSPAKQDSSQQSTSLVHSSSPARKEGEDLAISSSSPSSSPFCSSSSLSSSHLRRFNFNDLKAATRNFRPDSLLGEGGFGCVFKGWIDEHGTAPVKPGTGLTVAVKTLNHSGLQGHKEWLAELNFLGQLHHPNLVKLIGYCSEDDHRLLVYEFMQRGSLENHLFRKGAFPLPWITRMKVALGAAKGLAFLHSGKRLVIYRDFKTSNILLDADYNAKLSDFGLAKEGPEGDKTHVSTRVMGTYGYAAPEYVMTGHLTAKSDVYSFGVVLLEMLTGQRSIDKTRPNGEHNLVQWARPHLADKKRLFKIIDPRLEGKISVKGIQKSATLAYHCLSRDPKARPLMTEVVEMLKSLQNLKDMPNSTYRFQSVGADRDTHRLPSGNTNGNFIQMGRHDPIRPRYRQSPPRTRGMVR